MFAALRPSLVAVAVFTLLTGILYPVLITRIARAAFFPHAQGSILQDDGVVHGSTLIGQPVDDPSLFWSRPSATTKPYDASNSSGSNLGPSNPALTTAVADRIKALRAIDPDNALPIPMDLVTTSASGLDPHISPEAARYQVARIARARHVEAATLIAMIERTTEGRFLSLYGEPRVNVVVLNRLLERSTR